MRVDTLISKHFLPSKNISIDTVNPRHKAFKWRYRALITEDDQDTLNGALQQVIKLKLRRPFELDHPLLAMPV
ncbi:MAG: hypothetical protein CMI07_10390 [Oceanospirillaceae bacterium]|nr:hypothetical protein [Oceanospirillaceae bacterium]